MGEEASDADYDPIDAVSGDGDGDDDDDGEFDEGRVLEWEIGLPGGDELTPLSQTLVPPALASAFRINPEPPKSPLDVHRASQHTISNLRRVGPSAAAAAALRSFHPFPSHPAGDAADDEDETMAFEGEELAGSKDADGVESSARKVRRMDSASPSSVAAAATEEAESSAARPEISNDDQSAKMLKRTRLVWTPQLHKRFVDVVAHLGIKNAVPKTIMQLMNVEGLTRENVASHLQKYRLYLKRMHGLSNEGPSPSDQLFASTPVPQSLHEQQAPPPAPIPVPMPYVVPTMYPMPMFGVAHPHGPGNQMGVVPVNNHQVSGSCHGFEPHHTYGAFGDLPKDWSGGKQFGSIVSYPRVTPSDK